jgi:hypothetical protein
MSVLFLVACLYLWSEMTIHPFTMVSRIIFVVSYLLSMICILLVVSLKIFRGGSAHH